MSLTVNYLRKKKFKFVIKEGATVMLVPRTTTLSATAEVFAGAVAPAG